MVCLELISMHVCPAIQIGNDTISATDKTSLLGVLISDDLTFDPHATNISGHCFYQLCQLCLVQQLLDTKSIIYVKKLFYIQCKGDIVVVDIKQHKS